MLSEIPTSRFWGRGRVLVVHEATPCFFCFFSWELYQPAGCYRLSSAVLRKLGMVWLSADGPANSHFDTKLVKIMLIWEREDDTTYLYLLMISFLGPKGNPRCLNQFHKSFPS